MQLYQKGFTLIELMITVVIIAMLATLAYPTYQSFVLKTREENVRADLLTNVQILEQYYSVNKTFSTFQDSNLQQSKSGNYYTITGKYQNNNYVLTASPTKNNSNASDNIVYDSISGVLRCSKSNKACTIF